MWTHNYLRSQVGAAGLHTRSASQVLVMEPTVLYPMLQEYVATWLKVVKRATTVPLPGSERGPQLTAAYRNEIVI